MLTFGCQEDETKIGLKIVWLKNDAPSANAKRPRKGLKILAKDCDAARERNSNGNSA